MKLNNSIIVIPARKNSKRIIGKNLRKLDGKPLISHTIEYALQHVNSKNIWINSDDELALDLAKKYNISSYKRPSRLAEDETTTNAVVIDFCNYLINEGYDFKYIITLQPTNPIRSFNLLPLAMRKIIDSKSKSLMSVSNLHQKFGKLDNNKYLPVNYKIGQRHQDLEDLFYENGLIYISSKDCLINDKEYITDDVYPYLTNEIGAKVDIDYEDDLIFAELILKSGINNENSK